MDGYTWQAFGKCTLMAAGMAFASPLGAGWQNTEWGMTAEEVATAMEGRAPLDRGRRDDRLGDKEIRNVGEHRIGDARFRTVYHYDEAGLSHVALVRKSGNCEKIAAALLADYGKPIRISDQAILRLVIWHDNAAQNRIRLIVSSGLCNVNYERLSDYANVDLANSQAR